MIDAWRRALAPLRRYHRHRVEGLDNIPADGPALLVIHHSLATYDGFLFGVAAYEHSGRLPLALGDNLIFKAPILKDLAYKSGIVPASPQAGYRLLSEGRLLFVSPGGMWESLRPTEQARTVRWEGRLGFCRLALRAQVPLILIACPAADDIFSVRKSRVTDALYRRFKFPLPLFSGRGGAPIPRPVQLTHYVAPPIVPPIHDPSNEEAQIEALFAQARSVMGGLLSGPQPGL
jgi:1-acyl-sn-glycerol-3-phosphate acyltransferase